MGVQTSRQIQAVRRSGCLAIRTLSSKFDPDSCSHVTIATKLQTLHDSIETNLKLPDISASTRKSLEELQKDLGEIYLPMSHRLVNIFKEPAIAKTNVTRTRKDNAIGESNAAAKWLTEDNRRASVRALGAAMEADKNQANEKEELCTNLFCICWCNFNLQLLKRTLCNSQT